MDDFTSGNGWFDLSGVLSGADQASPLPDVSNGAPAMETYTPTGNGSGVFVDTSWQNQIFGGLNKVLDYAVQRDAYRMGALPTIPGTYGATSQQVYQQRRSQNGLMLLLLGVGIFALAKA